MAPPPTAEHWPPIYDAEDLATTIKRLVESNRLVANFFDHAPNNGGSPYQGDIIQLRSGVPLIDRDGQPSVIGDHCYWMVIGNTCDIAREMTDVTWSQIVPLVYVGADSDLSMEELAALRAYRYSRRFYVPHWSTLTQGCHHVADFLRPAPIHKNALRDVARVEARLNRYSWILLHSCLVRFLARDDGRFA